MVAINSLDDLTSSYGGGGSWSVQKMTAEAWKDAGKEVAGKKRGVGIATS